MHILFAFMFIKIYTSMLILASLPILYDCTQREAHKNLRNIPHGLDIYLVNVQTMRKIV